MISNGRELKIPHYKKPQKAQLQIFLVTNQLLKIFLPMIDNTRKMNDVCLQHLQIRKKLNVTFPALHTVGNKVNKYVGNTGLVKKGKEKQALIRFDSIQGKKPWIWL